MSTSPVRSRLLGAHAFELPIGRPAATSVDHVHVMDGDGTSLCEDVAAADLVRVPELRWRDVPISLRCASCRVIMQTYGASCD